MNTNDKRWCKYFELKMPNHSWMGSIQRIFKTLLLPSSFLPSSAQLAQAAGVVGRCVCLCMCMWEKQVARLDQMQASGGTAAVAPMPAFFTVSLPQPDSMCLFVFACLLVCVWALLDVWVFIRFLMTSLGRRSLKLQKKIVNWLVSKLHFLSL